MYYEYNVSIQLGNHFFKDAPILSSGGIEALYFKLVNETYPCLAITTNFKVKNFLKSCNDGKLKKHNPVSK